MNAPVPDSGVATVLVLAEAVHDIATMWQERRHAFGAAPADLSECVIGANLSRALDDLLTAYLARIRHSLETPDPPEDPHQP